jgi:predicted O-linked N-acetylglucosamine transferase (SPINDLY family)
LGDTLTALGRGADAAQCYESAIATEPGFARAWFASACLERDRHDYAAAAERFRQACQLRPEWAEAHHNLGQALFQTGQVDEALAEFKVAAEAGSGDVSRAMAAVIVPGSPVADNATILAVRQDWARREFAGTGRRDDRPQNAMVCPTKLRIGYLSSFFHRRNWMKPVWGVIHGHDRTGFEIHLFSDGPEEAIGEEYRRSAGDVFHDISGLSNEAAAAAIEQAGVDVLVDLNGYSAMARLPLVAARPAPVVIGWFNLYATSGMEAYDWLVGDAVTIPEEEEQFYCERIARVPGTYLAFEVGYPAPEVSAPPCLETGGRLAFGSLASQYKITPEVVAAWSAILRQAPGSTLLIRNAGLEAEGMRGFVRARFEGEGIGADRLDLEGPAEHDEFLGSYGRIDVALDPFPYNGGTTTMEALWQGVPVISFRGDRWAARTSASLELAAGLGEFVAAGREGYVALAVELARSAETPPRLAELRRNMRDRLRRSPACDTAGLARHLERIYREAVVFSPR